MYVRVKVIDTRLKICQKKDKMSNPTKKHKYGNTLQPIEDTLLNGI